MLKKRLIAVLVLREGAVVQSVQFKHTNVIHWKPSTAVDCFDRWAVDEIVALDVSLSKQRRELFFKVVGELAEKCFVPLTVGGWISDIDEGKALLRLGADKLVINTEALRRPTLISEFAEVFGSQCVVVSIDARPTSEVSTYEVFIDRGRQSTGLCPISWAVESERLGAGEIFLNCIERDGYRNGYDLNLLKRVVEAVSIPVIAMGGVFTWQHLVDGIYEGGADAVAAANIFHYTEHSTRKAKKYMKEAGIDVR